MGKKKLFLIGCAFSQKRPLFGTSREVLAGFAVTSPSNLFSSNGKKKRSRFIVTRKRLANQSSHNNGIMC